MIKTVDGETFEVTTTERGLIYLKGSSGKERYGTGIQAVIGGYLKIYQAQNWVVVSHSCIRLITIR